MICDTVVLNACAISESVSPAGECLSLIRYSRAVPLETDTGLMRDTALLVRGEISKPAKIRYLARRLLSNKGIKRIINRWRTYKNERRLKQ